eukprot:gnl/MRDRNA2_/MRDRNA2_138119_c0_seq1.p1 gnl/MRDRNA2_/MRDRNA2_138119_c0~~gnl/MRDRNA2_/MRDRNA2_138119_c0_seq1.p1  ORF type:complete len:169 (-),score=17.67 gnl/MRDRNA2_/MRDRNA2_138119_c0_seq1:45-551(-)
MSKSQVESAPNIPGPAVILPELEGILWKQSPSLKKQFFGKYQVTFLQLKEYMLLWWDDQWDFKQGRQPSGGLVFLIHKANLIQDPLVSSRFKLVPASREGWDLPQFLGGRMREFCFDTTGSEHSHGEWIQAILTHIRYAHEEVQRKGHAWIEGHVEIPIIRSESSWAG